MRKFDIPCALMCLTVTALTGVARAEETQEQGNGDLQEVLVSASKRGEQTILTTPMSIQAITADQLQKQQITQFADYARTVSGMSFDDQGPGDKKIVIRGLDSTGASTTGVYFDDIVVSGSNTENGGGRQPDFQLVDMQRIEVLKGPQGTLYGASSMSGTIRMLTNKPDASQTAGAVNVGAATTSGAGGANYNVDGMVNVPLIQDVLAARVVGYQNYQAGYIDNTLLGEKNVNNEKVAGGRVALRWTISSTATLDAMYVHQTTHTDGPAWYQPSFGNLVQAEESPEPWNEDMDAYNLALNWQVASGVVTASVSDLRRRIDYMYNGARVLCTLYGNPESTCFAYDNPTLESFRSSDYQPQSRDILSSELRYASQWSGPLQMVGGFFYEKDNNNFDSVVYGQDADFHILPDVNDVYVNRWARTRIEQEALFGELTYNITHALSVTGGVRVFHFDINEVSQDGAVNYDPVASSLSYSHSSESKATPKASVQYQFDGGPLLYFTYAMGFRAGGNNEPDFNNNTPLPPYDSDTLDSFEVGAKERLFNGALSFEGALYDMEWHNMQQRVSQNVLGDSVSTVKNVGDARIRGVELGVQSKPLPDLDLTMGLNATYLRAVITTPVSGVNDWGDHVPNVPNVTGNLWAEYGMPVLGGRAALRGEYEYVGTSYNTFDSTFAPYTKEGDYALVNFRLNFERDKYLASLYVDNAFNKLAVVTASIDTRVPEEAYPTRPRTVGFSVGYKF